MRLFSTHAFVFALLVSLPTFSGCGDEKSSGDIQVSEQTKKADAAGQDAMRDMMKKGGPAKSAKKKAY
jgi:hypothetical protein